MLLRHLLSALFLKAHRKNHPSSSFLSTNKAHICYSTGGGRLAQLVEQLTLNHTDILTKSL